MAKIHTVEWTPAIIAHPTTVYAMRANWYGILGKRLGRRSSNEVLGGIPGSATNHHGVPYSLTEEFVAVYRMHPLLPDDFTFRSRRRRTRCSRSARSRSSARSTCARGSTGSACRPRSTRSASPTRARSRCTTTRASSSTSSGPTGRGRPRRDRRPAHPRARRAALQRVPAPVPPEAGRDVRGADAEPGVGRGAPPRLRRRRARRPDGRPLRRAAAGGLRLQRHRVPRLHPDGVAAAQERPLLHARLHRRDLHAGRPRLDRRARRWSTC